MKQYSIDRFEGDFAVLTGEDETLDIRRDALPEGAAEGSIMMQTENGWMVCVDETNDRRLRLTERRRRLLEGKA